MTPFFLQNLLGFHLGEGVTFTYGSGAEYEDVAGVWDWNLLPGITTAYAATPLNCDTTGWDGTSDFVGGASTGTAGAAAMKWTNPINQSIMGFSKAWFFFEDGFHHVLIPGTSSSTSAEIYTVLDQKKHNTQTGIWVDGAAMTSGTGNFTSASTLWHDGTGYVFDHSAKGSAFDYLAVSAGNRQGDWSTIGTSSAGKKTVNMFSAYIRHKEAALNAPVSYSLYPGTNSYGEFSAKAKDRPVTVIQNDQMASSVLDPSTSTLMVVFWAAGGVQIPHSALGTAIDWQLKVSEPAIVVYDLQSNKGTIADPTQSLNSVDLTLSVGTPYGAWVARESVTVNLQPNGKWPGESIVFEFPKSIHDESSSAPTSNHTTRGHAAHLRRHLKKRLESI